MVSDTPITKISGEHNINYYKGKTFVQCVVDEIEYTLPEYDPTAETSNNGLGEATMEMPEEESISLNIEPEALPEANGDSDLP
jgi:hypothetical protein